MTAETNNQPKPKVKEPQKPPPTMETATPEFGSYAVGRATAGAASSSTLPGKAHLNPATSVFTSIVMRQMASGVPSEIPAHKTARGLRETAVLRMQSQFGNGQVNRLLVQRQDAGAPAGAPTTAPPEPKPTFSFARTNQTGSRFDSSYMPVGPAPEVGDLDINMWVHITYAPFTRSMMRSPDFRGHRWTREQMADFAWTDDEKSTFETGFMSSVQSAWSGQHGLHLNDPDFSEYRCRVNVNVISVSDPGMAHMKITAQKVPRGAPRFRSFVQGDTATLDIRDPSEPETSQVRDRPLIRQVKPFDVNSAEVNSTVAGQIQEIANTAKRQGITPGPQPGGGELNLFFRGRASATGSRRQNEQLGLRRAEAVKGALTAAAGWGNIGVTSSVGSENASTDPDFQRVDVVINNAATRQVQQNVAAHEAGHMFGLGDEYVDETPPAGAVPKFLGDEPTHYGDVQALIGSDAANEGLVQNSASMMSTGGTVQKGHYVYFVQAINQLTNKNWTVE